MSTRPSETDSQLLVPLLREPKEKMQELVYVKDDSALHQSIEERFHHLVKIWQADRPPNLRIADMVTHPAYQAIIGLGPAAIPYILHEVEHNLDHWFLALRAITGADPVPVESRGKLKEMAQAWLAWGRIYGFTRS
jgi:hypothetical protein